MSNPYLPNWEYIPDGEPRVFGDRVYIYGSHDRSGSVRFCDYELKPGIVIPTHYGSVVGSPGDGEAFKKLVNGPTEVVFKL